MDASYITPFIESTKSVFGTMLNLPVKCGRPLPESAIPAANADVSGIISLSGDVVGAVVLSFEMTAASAIVSRFVGMDVDPASEDFGDAVGELVNMVSGGAKAKFEGKNVSISCPQVVVGKGHKVHQMSDAVCIRIPCSSELGDFAVEVSMKNTNAKAAGTKAQAGTAG